MVEKIDGIKQIETAKWIKDEYGTQNLYVTTADGKEVQACLSLRPSYCDRGHIQLTVDGPLNIDFADSFPRYFFSFAEADAHTRTFLKWRLWKERTHRHELEVSDQLPPGAVKSSARCPTCGKKVVSIFDHIDIDCNADMPDSKIAELLAKYPPTSES